MIAGETEILIDRNADLYDEFWKKRTKAQKAKRKAKRRGRRKKFWKRVKNTIGDLASKPVQAEVTQSPSIAQGLTADTASDYKFSLQKPDPEKPGEDKKDSPVGLYILGGVVVLAVGVVAVLKLKRSA